MAETAGQPLIKLDVSRRFSSLTEVETHALSGIHLQIDKGEYVSIADVGLRQIDPAVHSGPARFATEGQYLLNGRPVAELPASERRVAQSRRFGFIFQSFNLIGDLTVFENVELPLTYRGMKAAERKQRVEAALERVGMAHRAKHLPSQLSGGQQQRVAVARAVAGSRSFCSGRATGTSIRAAAKRHGPASRAASRRRHHLHGDARPALRAHADRSIHVFDGRCVEEQTEMAVTE